MTDRYQIDAGQWPQILEDNWNRLRGQFAKHDDAGRWVMQIEALLLSPVTSEEIMHGIQWALIHVPADSYFTPGPKDIVGWIRRYRHEMAEQRDAIFENGKTYFELNATQKAEVKRAMRECVENLGAPEHVREATVQGYTMLQGGDAIKETDEYWNGTEWVEYGLSATDSEGRALRFVKYQHAQARRTA